LCELFDLCEQYCPLESDSVSFSVSTSMNIDYSLNAGIYVYYSSLKYILITEQSQMHIIDLILNEGGTLGLFIGVSFVSLFEISKIILEIIMIISGKNLN